jgi:uncharacterized protein (UPF0333 family)
MFLTIIFLNLLSIISLKIGILYKRIYYNRSIIYNMLEMDVKGQASVEYLLLALVFLIIIGSVTVPLVGKSIDTSMDVSDTANVEAAITTITNAVGLVYSNGPGAKRTLNVYFPVSGTLSIVNSRLQMPVTLSDGTTKNVNSTVPTNVTLSPSPANVAKGNYNVTVTWASGSSPILVTISS